MHRQCVTFEGETTKTEKEEEANRIGAETSDRFEITHARTRTCTKEWKALVVMFYREYSFAHTRAHTHSYDMYYRTRFELPKNDKSHTIPWIAINHQTDDRRFGFFDINTFSMDMQIVFSLYWIGCSFCLFGCLILFILCFFEGDF